MSKAIPRDPGAMVGQKGITPRVPRQTRHAAFGPDKRERDDVLIAFGENLRALRVAAGLS